MHLLKILFFLPLLLLPLATLTFAPQGIAAQPSGLPTETPTKSTDAIKNENCFKCHFESENEKVHTPAAKISTDVHGMAGLTCSSCHGGNPNALQGRDAHKDNFTTNPSPAAISKLCGKCHEKPLASWLTGPHGRLSKQPRQPDCVTCHGAHGIARASVELIGDPLCSS
ncbi:cytochrome c3 family protein, partial [Bdellovibrionota bacterium FG-1]